MRREVNERFEEMAKRYDAISAELVRTREELTRAVDGLLKLIEEFIRERREEERRRRK
jgi:creatinine amidohydrolase/Fe(II)-dependent formamide hydrolase-like protein